MSFRCSAKICSTIISHGTWGVEHVICKCRYRLLSGAQIERDIEGPRLATSYKYGDYVALMLQDRTALSRFPIQSEAMSGTKSESRLQFHVSFQDNTPESEIERPESPRIPIYTDGSYFHDSHRGGYGVYYPFKNHPDAMVRIRHRDSCPPLAELMGVKHAMTDIANELHFLKRGGTTSGIFYEIYTDSLFVINHITHLYKLWLDHGPSEMEDEVGQHLGVIFDIIAIYNFINVEYHKRGRAFLRLTHVKAHLGILGNVMADRYAKIGAKS